MGDREASGRSRHENEGNVLIENRNVQAISTHISQHAPLLHVEQYKIQNIKQKSQAFFKVRAYSLRKY